MPETPITVPKFTNKIKSVKNSKTNSKEKKQLLEQWRRRNIFDFFCKFRGNRVGWGPLCFLRKRIQYLSEKGLFNRMHKMAKVVTLNMCKLSRTLPNKILVKGQDLNHTLNYVYLNFINWFFAL